MNPWDLKEQPAESSSTPSSVVKDGGAAIVTVDAEVSSTDQRVVGWKTRFLFFCLIEFEVIWLSCVQYDEIWKISTVNLHFFLELDRNCVSSRPDHRGKGIRENKCTGADSYEVCRSKFRVHHQPCSGY